MSINMVSCHQENASNSTTGNVASSSGKLTGVIKKIKIDQDNWEVNPASINIVIRTKANTDGKGNGSSEQILKVVGHTSNASYAVTTSNVSSVLYGSDRAGTYPRDIVLHNDEVEMVCYSGNAWPTHYTARIYVANN